MNINYEVECEYDEISTACYAQCCVSAMTGSDSSYD